MAGPMKTYHQKQREEWKAQTSGTELAVRGNFLSISTPHSPPLEVGSHIQLMGNKRQSAITRSSTSQKINERELWYSWTNVTDISCHISVDMELLGRHHSASGRKQMLWTAFLLFSKSRCKLNSTTFGKALLWNWSSNPVYRELQWYRLCWKRGKK